MAKIPVTVRLDELIIHQDNESSPDEPYIVPLYAKLDGALFDPNVPIAQKHITLVMPALTGHGDLGPLSKGMHRDGRNTVSVPKSVGEWKTTLDTTNFDILPAAMTGACLVVVYVGVMEEDSTLDSTVRDVLKASKDKAQELADEALQTLLASTAALMEPISPDGVFDQDAIKDAIKPILLTDVLAKGIGKALSPFTGPGFFAELLAQADADDELGHEVHSYNVCQLIGLGFRPLKFEVRAHTTSDGDYSVTGVVVQTGSDEPPRLAAVPGPGNQINVFARRTDGNHPAFFHSDDSGKTFELVDDWPLRTAVANSGMSAYSNGGGMRQAVAHLGTDNAIRFAVSHDAGKTWTPWKRVPDRTDFKGTPAIACSQVGTGLYLFARNQDNHYEFSSSLDDGRTWAAWKTVGDGNLAFISSPAVVIVNAAWPTASVPLPQLLVAGHARGGRIWWTRFLLSQGDPKHAQWKALQNGPPAGPLWEFNSAPSLAISENGKYVVCAARAANYRFFTSHLFFDGIEMPEGTPWQAMGLPDDGPVSYGDNNSRSGDLQHMFSAPAVVLAGTPPTFRVFGLSSTLGLWRIRYDTLADKRVWHPFTEEPEPAFRAHYF